MSASPPGPSLWWRHGSTPRRDPLRFDAGLQPPDLPPVVGRRRAGPGGVVDEGGEAAPDAGIARDRASPQQRLALPDLGPSLQVHGVAVEAPGQRPLLAFGTEIGVDGHDPSRRRRATQQPEEGGRGPFRLLPPLAAVSVVDEDEIDVGGVRQGPAAEPSHGDDREGHCRCDHPARGLDHRLGQCAEVVTDLLGVGVAEHVATDDPEQVAPVPAPQRLLLVVGVRCASPTACHALANRSSPGEVRSCSTSSRRSTRSGLASSSSVAMGAVVSRSHSARAVSAESRNAAVIRDVRCSPVTRRRSPSRPEIGVGTVARASRAPAAAAAASAVTNG